MSEETDKAHAAGREAGRIDQILAEHTAHFITLNGSVEKTGDKLAELASEIRGLREDARIREERVEVAAETLATETERRRKELAGTVDQQDRVMAGAASKFTRRERIAAVIVTVALAVIGYFVAPK